MNLKNINTLGINIKQLLLYKINNQNEKYTKKFWAPYAININPKNKLMI